MDDFKTYFLIVSCGVAFTVGDISMKKWIVSREALPYIFGILIYILGVNLLAQSYLYRNIAIATTIANIMNVCILSVVSWIVFHDKLTEIQIVGLVLALVSIVLMEMK